MVGEWVKTVLNMEAEPSSEEMWKWMGEDYAKGKLGLIPDVVVDVGIVVVSPSKTLQEGEVNLLSDMLLQRKHAAIPLTAVLDASHVATRYLKLQAPNKPTI
jgi:hypothetical protein